MRFFSVVRRRTTAAGSASAMTRRTWPQSTADHVKRLLLRSTSGRLRRPSADCFATQPSLIAMLITSSPAPAATSSAGAHSGGGSVLSQAVAERPAGETLQRCGELDECAERIANEGHALALRLVLVPRAIRSRPRARVRTRRPRPRAPARSPCSAAGRRSPRGEPRRRSSFRRACRSQRRASSSPCPAVHIARHHEVRAHAEGALVELGCRGGIVDVGDHPAERHLHVAAHAENHLT
jgi:hypothetical protein